MKLHEVNSLANSYMKSRDLNMLKFLLKNNPYIELDMSTFDIMWALENGLFHKVVDFYERGTRKSWVFLSEAALSTGHLGLIDLLLNDLEFTMNYNWTTTRLIETRLYNTLI